MKALFKRGPILGFRLLIAIILSIVLMVADQRAHNLHQLRQGLMVVTVPIQYFVDLPMRITGWLQINIASHQALLKENAHLRAQHLLLQAQVQKFLALRKENSHLRALLRSATKAQGKVVVAQLLAVDSDPYVHQIVLNKGKKQGVYVGQPVLDANGVMGKVIRVAAHTSEVLLLTDTRSAIPVQDNSNGERAIAIGFGSSGSLRLAYVPKTTGIKLGDTLVTSGLGQEFPAGYPVGVVSAVKSDPGEHFISIEIKPSARINQSRLVLLVWPGKGKAKS